jgi:hypothetical protein
MATRLHIKSNYEKHHKVENKSTKAIQNSKLNQLSHHKAQP